MDDALGLPKGAFTKIDGEEDEHFYEEPRLVYHIDDKAVAALTNFYRAVLPGGGVLNVFFVAAGPQPVSGACTYNQSPCA